MNRNLIANLSYYLLIVGIALLVLLPVSWSLFGLANIKNIALFFITVSSILNFKVPAGKRSTNIYPTILIVFLLLLVNFSIVNSTIEYINALFYYTICGVAPFICLKHTIRDDKLHGFLISLVAIGTAASFALIYEFATGNNFYEEFFLINPAQAGEHNFTGVTEFTRTLFGITYHRSIGAQPSPLDSGVVSLLMTTVTIYAYLLFGKKFLFPLICIILGLFCSLSYGSIAALLVGLFIYILSRIRFDNLAPFVLAFILILFFIFWGQFSEILDSSSADIRYDRIKSVLNYIVYHDTLNLLFGYGLGAFKYGYFSLIFPTLQADDIGLLIIFIIETGLILSVALYISIIKYFLAKKNNCNLFDNYGVYVLISLTVNLLSYSDLNYIWVFSFMYGLACTSNAKLSV